MFSIPVPTVTVAEAREWRAQAGRVTDVGGRAYAVGQRCAAKEALVDDPQLPPESGAAPNGRTRVDKTTTTASLADLIGPGLRAISADPDPADNASCLYVPFQDIQHVLGFDLPSEILLIDTPGRADGTGLGDGLGRGPAQSATSSV